MEGHRHEIYLINDGHGIKENGHAAYFVEEGLYEKAMADFERETANTRSPAPGIP